MSEQQLWVCECGREKRCDGREVIDWDEKPSVLGPDCPECGCEMVAFDESDRDPTDTEKLAATTDRLNAEICASDALLSELNSLRAQLARKSQLANRLAFVVLHFWRSRDYWHQRFRWCASYSGRLQMERERDLTQRLEREREFND